MGLSRYIHISCLLILLMISCSEEEEGFDIIHSIPDEDRFIFNESDKLFYYCSDGTIDTVLILSKEFWSESHTNTQMFGVKYTCLVDYQIIEFKIFNDRWKRILNDALSNQEIALCFKIETISTYIDENPYCMISNPCQPYGAVGIAESGIDHDEIIINKKKFHKVYHYLFQNENKGYEIFWNLKYGIIRFAGIDENIYTYWELKL